MVKNRTHAEWVSKIKSVFLNKETLEEEPNKISSHSMEMEFRHLWSKLDKSCDWIKKTYPKGNEKLVKDLIEKVAKPADEIWKLLDKKTRDKLLTYMYPERYTKKAVESPPSPASKNSPQPSFKSVQQKDLLGNPLVTKKKKRRKSIV